MSQIQAQQQPKNYIIVRRYGGLANQIFIVAATYCIQQNNKEQINILLAPCASHDNIHFASKYDYYQTLFSHFPHTIEVDIPHHLLGASHLLMNLARLKKISYQSPQSSAFSPWDPSTVRIPCVLEGYFQFYPIIKPHIQDICKFLIKGLTEIRSDILQKYPNIRDTAFLHVRRGDYMGLSHYHFLQPIDYYERALSLLATDIPILVFSDDIDYCKGVELFKNRNCIFIDEPDEVIALGLMSLCEKGAICANSTFSYWGAMLGAHSNGNTVIVPKDWCKDPPISLFPDNWLIL